MRTLWLAIWFGSVLGCVVKLASPHRKPAAWVLTAFIGGFGALAGLFLCRFVGIGREDILTTVVIADTVSVGLVILYAVLSRILYAMQRRPSRDGSRQTRPTIVF